MAETDLNREGNFSLNARPDSGHKNDFTSSLPPHLLYSALLINEIQMLGQCEMLCFMLIKAEHDV